MTSELQQLANDPNFVVQFAVGDPFPSLVPQQQNSTGIRLSGVYFSTPKRYVLKKARMSRDDNRIFDVDSGHLVYVSHHLGKNPYDAFDPLDLTNLDAHYSVNGGEWESVCYVSGQDPFPSFKVRPKKLSRHGRQYVKLDGSIIMNVGKMSKFKTMSMRPHFMVGRGSDTSEVVYKCVADIVGRTIAITNENDELVAQMTKTNKAMIKTAVFGSGSESTIDIAPGVDCSAILALVYAIGQVGKHYVSDAFNNFFVDPLKSSIVGSVVDNVTGDNETEEAFDDGNIDNEIEEDFDDGDISTSIEENMQGVSDFFASFFGDDE